MGDRIWAGKHAPRYVTASEVDSALFYRPGGKSAFEPSNNNKWRWWNGGYSLPAAYTVYRVGLRLKPVGLLQRSAVTSPGAMLYSARVNSRNGLPWWQHYKRCNWYYEYYYYYYYYYPCVVFASVSGRLLTLLLLLLPCIITKNEQMNEWTNECDTCCPMRTVLTRMSAPESMSTTNCKSNGKTTSS